MTFPSRGCQTCKLRRIKCDEARPVCRRCTKAKRACFGMRQACSVVHIENSYASGRRKRPRGPRAVPAVKTTSKVDAIPRRPLVDLKTTAVWYYLHYHLQPPDDPANTSRGVSDEFLPMWKSKSDCPLLDLAISSMALAVFSRTKQHLPAATEASTAYHQLLKTVRATIPSLSNENIDRYLIAMFFMSRYENVVHCINHLNHKLPFATTLKNFLHHDGALAILKVWKSRLSHTQLATDVIKHSRRGLIRSAILRKLAIPEWMRDGTDFGEQGLELEYDRIVVRLAILRQRLSVLRRESPYMQRSACEPNLTAEELTEEALGIDQALHDWATRFPSNWHPERHNLSNTYSCPTEGFYTHKIYHYATRAYAAIWNQYYSTRMLVNSTRMRALELSQSNTDYLVYKQQRAACLSHIMNMGDDLAASVPYCLHRFKVGSPSDYDSISLNTNKEVEPYVAALIVWPLGIASSLGDVNETQKAWFRAELRNLGRLIGDRVLEDGDTDQWGL